MCIISGPVTHVSSTRLCCIPSKNGRRQLTVYRNEVATPDVNAMCLPVPNPASVKFEEVPKDIFSQCSSSFHYPHKYERTWSLSSSSRSTLAIQSHGSYEVVLVPSMNDFDRIPSPFNTLTPEVITFLQTSYPASFGIVLCRLKQGHTDYEPFAYSHEIQANGKLFFPTKHYHVHKFTQTIPYEFERLMPTLHKYANDWDHELFSIGTGIHEHVSEKKEVISKNAIRWDEFPEEFQHTSRKVMRCREIVGDHLNTDIEMILVA